jgi:hypothetical protein
MCITILDYKNLLDYKDAMSAIIVLMCLESLRPIIFAVKLPLSRA